MSGQLLVEKPSQPDETHLRARFTFTDGGRELRFVDQRTFGGLAVEESDGDGSPRGWRTSPSTRSTRPSTSTRFSAALRRRHTEVKRALLDQTLIGGVGNIYADEALWRARLHGARPTDKLTRGQVADLLDGVRDVLGEALAQGGTSFDSLYVDVNGQSGYFSRFLAVYGQARPAVPPVRDADPPGVVHEPVQLQLPDVPAAPASTRGHDHAASVAVVSGHVQGVGYRWFVRELAPRGRPAPARPRNLPDGRVEVVLEGPEDDVAALRRRAGRSRARRAPCRRVDHRDEAVQGSTGFTTA